MLAMYRILQQDDCAEENIPVGSSRGFLYACGFAMRWVDIQKAIEFKECTWRILTFSNMSSTWNYVKRDHN